MRLMICSFVVCFLVVSAHSYKDALCPNCQDGTCCGEGCCPLASAVCCPDGLSCCPSGTSCGPNKKCYGQHGDTQPSFKSTAPVKSKNETKVRSGNCAGPVNPCSTGQTCCTTADGIGCCPQPDATCCSDEKHCCPSGETCGNPGDNHCYASSDTEDHLTVTSVKANSRISEIGDVPCPGGGSCADGNTCCPNSAGGYSCCPQVGATCCSDGKHCCPQGYSTCCSDGEHCCPSGTTCGNPGDNHCYASGDTADLLMMTSVKANSKISEIGSVICPDGGSCADENTCCPNSAGGYGCCPQVDATCCSDGRHCCPSGYTCGVDRCSPSQRIHPIMTLV